MKRSKLPTAILLLCAALVVSDTSWAHRGDRHTRARVGVFIGGPVWPWYYSYPPSYYYFPPVIAVPTQPAPPPVYIEQATESPPAESYWYYCGSSKTYYPYVQQCPEGWQQVLPQAVR